MLTRSVNGVFQLLELLLELLNKLKMTF